MALLSRLRSAFQLGAFQSRAFQVDTTRVDAAGDFATPQEIAHLERLRRIRKWQNERRRRYELRKRRELDAAIDRLLAERPDSEIPASQRAILAKAKSAVQPLKPFRPQPSAPATPLGNQLSASAALSLPGQERQGGAHVAARLAAYGTDQAARRAAALARFADASRGRRQVADKTLDQLLAVNVKPQADFHQLATPHQAHSNTALHQLLALPTKPARMTPDQLLAALAQGNREMQRLRGY